MRRWICTFVVCIWHKQVFLWRGSYDKSKVWGGLYYIGQKKDFIFSGSAVSVQKVPHIRFFNQENTWQMNFVIYQRIKFLQIATQITNVWYSCLPAKKIGKLRSVYVVWDWKVTYISNTIIYRGGAMFFFFPTFGNQTFSPNPFWPKDVSDPRCLGPIGK